MDTKQNEFRPAQGAAPFEQGEVFYSRTDKRGVIQSGNYIFRRVADYDWGELLGAPHKKIRHPDTPKGLFFLMWERLNRGDIVGAYVKNMAKDGLHYWVYAVAMPFQDGFLSVRIKPCSDRLQIVEDMYARACAREVNDGATPEDSGAWITAQVAEMGFETYDAFAVDSLSEELTAESSALGIQPDKRIAKSLEMLKITEKLVVDAAELFEEFTVLAGIPKNMQIKASLLEPTGGPLTALSKNYGHMSDEISERFTSQVFGTQNNFAKISQSVKDAMLLNNTAEILRRCDVQLVAEQQNPDVIDHADERLHISGLTAEIREKARAASNDIISQSTRIDRACDDIGRILLALQTVCVNCKIENACLGENAGSLDMIIDQLTHSQARVEEQLRVITTSLGQILDAAGESNQIDIREIGTLPPYGQQMADAATRHSAPPQSMRM